MSALVVALPGTDHANEADRRIHIVRACSLAAPVATSLISSSSHLGSSVTFCSSILICADRERQADSQATTGEDGAFSVSIAGLLKRRTVSAEH